MSRYLSVMEVRQMMGRAGRPRYDPKGEAWLACKGGDPRELADEIADRYIHGPVEDISSKLASEPAMRFHLLAGIATGGLLQRGDIGAFFASTYLGHTQPQGYLQETIDKMLSWLVSKRFIRRTEQHSMTESWDDETPAWLDSALSASGVSLGGTRKSRLEPREATFGFQRASNIAPTETQTLLGESVENRYEATAMGERIAQLMIDPLSADVMISGLRRAVRRLVRRDLPVTEFGICHLITATPDFLPFYAKASELVFGSDLNKKAAIHEDDLLVESPLEERALGLVKSAWCIEEWYEESDLRSIEKTIGVSPGDVHTRVNLMGWLLVAAREVLLRDDVFADEHLGYVADLAGFIDLVARRVRAGCKEDLLQLIQVKNIGRTRARTLSKIGVRTPADLLALSHKELESLKSRRGWGPLLVERILDEVNKLTRKSVTKKPRSDDEPLPSERV
jgi:helicase